MLSMTCCARICVTFKHDSWDKACSCVCILGKR